MVAARRAAQQPATSGGADAGLAARPQQHSGYGGGLKFSTSAPVLPMDKLARKGKPPGIPACKTMLHWGNS